MVRALGILIAGTAVYAATLTDDRIADVVKRLNTLSAKESPVPRADTLRRESVLLRNVQPVLAASLATEKAPGPATTARRSCSAPAGLDEEAKTLFVEDAFGFIQALPVNDQRLPLIELLDCAEGMHVDRKLIESVARQFLNIVEHTTESPEDYERLSALRRRYELAVGSDNVSVRARDALAELAALVSTDYDFALNLLSGQKVTLREQRGKVVVITFWATWCGPCINEMSVFEKLYRNPRSDAFQLFAITDEPGSTVAPFMKENGYTFPVVLDPQRITFEHYRIPGMPATVIIDRTGRVRAEAGAITAAELNHLLAIAGLSPLQSQLN